jgi:two-component system chemotaxis sensor kinase CheA
MGGRVEIESMLGVGTRMTVRLPLTLAILDGMSVAVGDQTYILPLSYVIESLQPEMGDIKTLSNHARVIQVRGEYLPVVVLHEVFNIKPSWSDFTRGIMVVLDADGGDDSRCLCNCGDGQIQYAESQLMAERRSEIWKQ